MDLEQKEGIVAQEKAIGSKKSLLKEHKFMLLATLLIVVATLFVTFLPRGSSQNLLPRRAIITPPLAIITATPPPAPSRWATSSAILKIEKDTRDLQSNINNTDYQDPVLTLPNIDNNVDFHN
ncbi:hypothetical protein HY030_00090 [Candidatus Gottesmanbacteria bacterium]|nr:hypothetical protein [Candidatus Gottesmanbacteria bacterium]